MLLQYLFHRYFKVPRSFNFLKSIDEDFSKVYELIANFENYSSYIPGCSRSELIEKQDEFEIGELEFSFLLRNYSIKSKNTLTENTIKIEQVEGPFNFFIVEWNISRIKDSETLIKFEAEFELPLLLNNLLPKKLIDRFCEKVIDAFVKRISKNN